MKNKASWIIVAASLVVLIASANGLYQKYSDEVEMDRLLVEDGSNAEISEDIIDEEQVSEESSSQEQEVMAPDFTVYDTEGNAVKLSEYIGKPVVLNFWASWCGPCKMEMPDFDEKYKELGNDIHFLMVNMTDGSQETLETAKTFVEKSGYSFSVYFDTDMDAAMTYGVTSIPSTYFIDAEGHAIAMAQGMIDASTLQQGIDMIVE